MGAAGIPRKRNAWSKVVLVGVQVAVLLVKLVTEAVVQSEIRLDRPCILEVKSGPGTVIGVDGAAESLLVELGQAQGHRLAGAEESGIRGETAGSGNWQAGVENT